MRFLKKHQIFGFIVLLTLGTEVSLRFLGFANPPLSQKDADTGYRFQPNQKINRFGRNIEYNQYSQRSEPISLDKSKNQIRILMTGDSVLNGGNPIDQYQTITELFEAKLVQGGSPSEILNASAGSWGIGNQLGYIEKFGTFKADALILQIGTHDLTQGKSKGDVVGTSINYPDRRPSLAIQEAFLRYALPHFQRTFFPKSTLTRSPQQLDQQFHQNMESLKIIANIAQTRNIPLFVLFSPNREDLLPTPKTPAYKNQFLQVLNTLKIPVIDTHTAWSNLPSSTVETYFRDGVHLTETGNQATADLLYQKICLNELLSVCSIK